MKAKSDGSNFGCCTQTAYMHASAVHMHLRAMQQHLPAENDSVEQAGQPVMAISGPFSLLHSDNLVVVGVELLCDIAVTSGRAQAYLGQH